MTDARQAQILEMVREIGSASIEQLAAHFTVTQQTIRRIVNPLCEQGLLRRVHGGVGLPVSSQNLAYQSRQKLNLEAKQKIAKAVANFIPDGASVMIGLGTTPECVALALAGRSSLRVITNSLSTAMALAINPDIEITMAGGTLRPHDRDIIGDPAAQFFSGFKADFGIFGVGGIDEDGSLLDFYVGEVQARQAIAANCRTTMLVVDAHQVRPQRHRTRRPLRRLPSHLHRPPASVEIPGGDQSLRRPHVHRERGSVSGGVTIDAASQQQ